MREIRIYPYLYIPPTRPAVANPSFVPSVGAGPGAGGVTFWEPSSGARFVHAGGGGYASTYSAAESPYRTLSCVFSHGEAPYQSLLLSYIYVYI